MQYMLQLYQPTVTIWTMKQSKNQNIENNITN